MSNIYITEPPTSGSILLTTSRGPIQIELWSKETPLACRNFIQLCLEGYFLNLPFHRIVPNFLIQSGDPTRSGHGGESIYPQGRFKDEFHSRLRYNKRGMVGMSSTSPNDNASQFFITLDATPELQGKNTLFGKVVGDTIYNVLKIGEGEVKDDRPLYETKILKTEVLSNPFPDIVPRLSTGNEMFVPKQEVKKGIRNRKLLSFADDGEDAGVVIKPRIRSVHDMKAPTTRQPEPDVTESKQDTKQTTKEDPKDEHEERPATTKEATESIQAQIDAMKAKMKRKPVVEKKEEKILSYVEQQRMKYASKAIIGKRRKLAEDDTLKQLSNFQQKLKQVKPDDTDDKNGTEEKCELHNVPNCQSCGKSTADQEDVTGDSWLAHKLIFPQDGLGKDLTDRERRELELRIDGGLEVIDPRLKAGQIRIAQREEMAKNKARRK